MTIWLLEGTEGTGKSTAAEFMAKDLGCGVVHFGPPRPGVMWQEEYLQPVINAMVAYGTPDVVMDRGFLSEFVWSPYQGRESITADFFDRVRMLETFLTLDTRIVMFERPAQEILDVLEDRGEWDQHRSALEVVPMYRTEARNLKRYGFSVTTTTLNDWRTTWTSVRTTR